MQIVLIPLLEGTECTLELHETTTSDQTNNFYTAFIYIRTFIGFVTYFTRQPCFYIVDPIFSLSYFVGTFLLAWIVQLIN